jgi:hypothetical protein
VLDCAVAAKRLREHPLLLWLPLGFYHPLESINNMNELLCEIENLLLSDRNNSTIDDVERVNCSLRRSQRPFQEQMTLLAFVRRQQRRAFYIQGLRSFYIHLSIYEVLEMPHRREIRGSHDAQIRGRGAVETEHGQIRGGDVAPSNL